MKSIYDLLNKIDLNLQEFNEIKLNDFEKKNLKNNVYKKLKLNRKKKFKKGAIAAAITFLTIMSIGVVNPTFADNISFVSNIIGKLTYGIDNKDLQKYSTIIDKTITNKGIDVTLTEVAMDDNVLNIAYKIHDKNNIIKSDTIPSIFQALSVKINGKKLMTSGGGRDEKIDENTIIIVQDFDIEHKKIPKKINMDIQFNKLLGKSSNWNFNFKVSKEKICKNTKNIYIHENVKVNNSEIFLKKLSISPLSTCLTYSGKQKKQGDIIENFILLDEKGKEIPMLSSNMFTSFGKSKGAFKYDIISNKNINKITLIPAFSQDYFSKNAIKAKKLVPIELTKKLPITLKQNNKNSLIITDTDFEKDKVIITYKCKGLSPFLQYNRLYLYDENKKRLETTDNDAFNYESSLKDYREKGIFKKAFKLNNSKKYYVGTDNMKEWKIYENNKIEININ